MVVMHVYNISIGKHIATILFIYLFIELMEYASRLGYNKKKGLLLRHVDLIM